MEIIGFVIEVFRSDLKLEIYEVSCRKPENKGKIKINKKD